MKKSLSLLTLCMLLLVYSSKAQQAAPVAYSLADCIKYAYEHQDSVKNAELDAKSAEYKVKETKGLGLPQINGSAQFQKYLKIPTQVVPASAFYNPSSGLPAPGPDDIQGLSFGVKYNTTLAVDATQILFDGTFLVGLKAVKTYTELSQRNLTRSKIETNINVTKAYYQVLVGNEQLRLFDANISQLKQQLDQTSSMNKQGFVEKIDVDRLTVEYNNLVTNRENIARSLVLYVQMLKFQMGMPIEEKITLTDKLENVKLDQQIASLSVDTSFYHNRIEYNLLETNVKLNQIDVLSKKAAFLPSLSAYANVSTAFQQNKFSSLYGTDYPFYYFGFRLRVPIFDGFQRSYQLKETMINVQKAENDLYNAKNGFKLQAQAAQVTFYNGLQSLNNQKRSRELAQEVLRVSKIKYQQGVGSSIEVTQAQTAVETADNQYIQALYNALISKVDLDKAYGKIN